MLNKISINTMSRIFWGKRIFQIITNFKLTPPWLAQFKNVMRTFLIEIALNSVNIY